MLHGVKQELTELTELKGVRGPRARALYNAGFTTARHLADRATRVEDVAAALLKGAPGGPPGPYSSCCLAVG